MKEVTISPKTAFRLIQWLSQDNDADARALVNLLSREALGDIKAEESAPVRTTSDGVLRAFMKASGFTDNDGVPTMLNVLTYRKSVTAAADAVAADSNMDSAVYLVNMKAELNQAQRKLEQITNIFNERPRSDGTDWARIGEILG